MAEKGEAEFPILAEGTSVHALAGGRWWKGLPLPSAAGHPRWKCWTLLPSSKSPPKEWDSEISPLICYSGMSFQPD